MAPTPTADSVLKGVDDVLEGDMDTPEAQQLLAAGARAAEKAEAEATVVIPFDDHHVTMTTRMSSRDMLSSLQISHLNSKVPEQALKQFELVAGLIERHVVDHDYDNADILDLDPEKLTKLYVAWGSARKEGALPKPSGNRSQRRSQRRR